MVNTCELLINVVNEDKPKMLKSPRRADRLGPKGKALGPSAPGRRGSGMGVHNSPIADGELPAKRQDLTHADRVLVRNVVSS